MYRVENDKPWHLFCPTEAPLLLECHGAIFDKFLVTYEILNMGHAYKAREVWQSILRSVCQRRGTSIMYLNAVNGKPTMESLEAVHEITF